MSDDRSIVDTVNLQRIASAVKTVQTRIESNFLYRLLSWIPYTYANALSHLIVDVRRVLDEKQQFLKKKIETARSNAKDPNDFFIASNAVMRAIRHSKESLELNKDVELPDHQALLFWPRKKIAIDACLHEVEKQVQLGYFTIDFALPFIVEFTSDSLVKIVRSPEAYNKGVIARYTNSRTRRLPEFINRQIRDIFAYLSDRKLENPSS